MRRVNKSPRLFSVFAFTVILLLAPQARAQTVLVQPYVQPGDGSTLTGTDVKVLCWWTDQQAGEFQVEYRVAGASQKSVLPKRTVLDFPSPKPPEKKDTDPKTEPKLNPLDKEQRYFKYTANLNELPFNSDVSYRVKLGERVIREGTFRTRATADKAVRCVMVGDMADGRAPQKTIAYQISLQKPEFLVALGDVVYQRGRVSEYMKNFWHTYNDVAEPGPKAGAPLMASVPFYALMGNHDISAKLPATPDAFGAYYVFCPPRNGPGIGPWATQLGNDPAVAAKFRAATADSYPYLDVYSFDYGPAHFVMLNNNPSMKLDDPAFRKWLRDDLKASKAPWKIVCFHIPGFHSTITHYTEQQARVLEPLFDECGVDMTFAGHVHNYQRTMPLRFKPDDTKPSKKTMLNGVFTLDQAFDGVKNTKPNGVIHIVAGGGGASLYGPALDKTAPKLREAHGANFTDFTAKLVSEENSFVVLDITPQELRLTALGVKGNELDIFKVTKK